MKKNNNIKQLKEMVNANDFEAIECVKYGVQAYNMSANEYEVITKFAKINGRYYFVDRNGNKYLASRYDRAELVARDILDNLKYAEETAYEYVCNLEEKKQIAVDAAYLPLFFDFCDLFGFEVESIEAHFHNNGDMCTVYRLKSEQTAQDDAQSGNNAADEQSNEDNEDGENAAACEPSKLSGILAKMKGSARKVCEKVAFAMFIAVVGTVSLLALYFSVLGLGEFLEVLGIEGGTWTACAVSLLLFPTVILEFVLSVEQNLMAAIDRLFPSFFEDWQRVNFAVPFTFWYRLIKESRK